MFTVMHTSAHGPFMGILRQFCLTLTCLFIGANLARD